MEAFKALSFSDRWRVRRFVFRGEAPGDPRLAAAAVELAERYRRRDKAGLSGWAMLILLVSASGLLVRAAIDGDTLGIVISGVLMLGAAAHFALNPATRPKRVARSLEASRQLTAQDS
jgi:hypothetical protein